MCQLSNVKVRTRGLLSQCKKTVMDSQSGMTLLELLIALMMLVTFTGVVVMVMEFTLRFLRDTKNAVGNGALIDHIEAQLSMDQLVEVLSQPGISKEDIEEISTDCTDNPAVEWKGKFSNARLFPEIYPPLGYQFCLRATSVVEDEWEILLANGKPGIYILQALPDGPLGPSRLPVRRLFCRPRPFCEK